MGNQTGRAFGLPDGAWPTAAAASQSSTEQTIGGTMVYDRNVISASSGNGVAISDGSTGNVVLGNYIGTNAAGTAALANSNHGILGNDSPNNTIGGTAAGGGKLIAFNSQKGIVVLGFAATGNRLLGNLIFSNGSVDIDLNNDGVAANDAGDADTGPNNWQNFPVLGSDGQFRVYPFTTTHFVVDITGYFAP